MNIEIFVNFIYNILILLSMGFIFFFFKHAVQIHPMYRKILSGLLLSLVIVFVMLNSFHLTAVDDGLHFDTRAVMISVSGMFFGFIPTLIALITAIIVRVVQGGVGMLTGVTWIIFSGFLGLLWNKVRLKKLSSYKNNWIELYIFSIIVQIIMILLLFTLPSGISMKTINLVAFPLLVIYPLGSLLISYIILYIIKKEKTRLKIIESKNKYTGLFTKNRTCLILVDAKTGKVVDVNDSCMNQYGYSYDEFLRLNLSQLKAKDTTESKEELCLSIQNSSFNRKHITKSGLTFDAEIYCNFISLKEISYMYLTVIDVSEKMQSERMFKDADDRLRATLLSVGEGIVVADEYSRITIANQKALDLIGETKSLERHKLFEEFRIYSNQNNEDFESIYNQCIQSKKMFRSDNTYSLLTNDNKTIFIDFTISPINSENGINHGAILVLRDITIEKERLEEVRFMSRHDYLTKLYNRYNFETELKRLDTKRQLPISLIIGDINGLKLVNDAFGHLEGDRLIKEVADIFKKATRSEDIVARWGGDEFAILLPQTDKIGAESVTNRIKDLCEKSMYNVITPSISLGISTKTILSQDIRETLTQAEEVMYNHKLTEGPKMREELVLHLLQVVNTKVIDNESHTDNLIALFNQYCEFYNLDNKYKKACLLLAKYHDIGRISISDDILNKVDDLTEYDWTRIKSHPEIGSRLVATIPELQHLSKSILQHHERFDGKGYPLGLSGNDIDEYARLLAIFDSYESITNTRVYREARSHDDAINEILKHTGTQFDPELVQKFINIFKR